MNDFDKAVREIAAYQDMLGPNESYLYNQLTYAIANIRAGLPGSELRLFTIMFELLRASREIGLRLGAEKSAHYNKISFSVERLVKDFGYILDQINYIYTRKDEPVPPGAGDWSILFRACDSVKIILENLEKQRKDIESIHAAANPEKELRVGP